MDTKVCPLALAAGRGTVPAVRRRRIPAAESQRKTPRPERANTLTLFAHPGFLVQEKEPPVRSEPACGSSRASVSRCRKGAARTG